MWVLMHKPYYQQIARKKVAIQMRMLTDSPANCSGEDLSGFRAYASLLADGILDTQDLPNENEGGEIRSWKEENVPLLCSIFWRGKSGRTRSARLEWQSQFNDLIGGSE